MKKASLIFTIIVVAASSARAVTSPNGIVGIGVDVIPSATTYTVTGNGITVIDRSPLLFTLDGQELLTGATIDGKPQPYSVDESYAWRGPHSNAINHCNGERIPLKTKAGPVMLELRAYDDGVAYRIIVPSADNKSHTPDERSKFILPEGSRIWSHDLSGHYEGSYTKRKIEELRKGQWAGPPVTIKLPNGSYAAITEAGLVNYSGMALQFDGQRGLEIGLAHRQPISHPFELRYKEEDIERLSKPAAIDGTITTPWRVILIGKDLNTLVNSDIIPNLAPPPDPKIFPNGVNTEWTRCGRAVWRYLDSERGDNDRSVDQMKEFNRNAGALGFEYNVIEGFWRRFSDAEIRDLVQFGKEQHVGQFVWIPSWEQRDSTKRQALFKRCHELGIVGLKIDFFDHEHKEMIDLYHAILKDAADNHLMVIFHGANKPTGEQRAWPNEMNREAVKGMESSRLWERAKHETTLPFTRWLAGPADYTPVHPGDRRADTTWAHQIASAAIFEAPIVTYAANPQRLLANPAVDMIKSIPAVWDQTIVLPPSEIGELAVFARRKGNTWFLAIMNGPLPHNVTVPLQFLEARPYTSLTVRDAKSVPMTRAATKPSTGPATADPATAAVDIEQSNHVKRDNKITIDLPAGGGMIARFDPNDQASSSEKHP